MPAPRKYPDELRERAVRMVFEVRATGESYGSIARVADQLGIHREALRGWVRQAEIDTGRRAGTSSSERERITELERENRELRRANEILKSGLDFLRGGARPPTQAMSAYIDAHRDHHGVEPICRTLGVAPSTYYAAKTRRPSARAIRAQALKPEITRVYQSNYRVYGRHKIRRQMNREGVRIGRDQVARLMGELGIAGVVRGKVKRTTVSDPRAERAPDLVERRFVAERPTSCGSPTSPMPPPGRTPSMSPSSSMSSRGASSDGAPTPRCARILCSTPWRWRSGPATRSMRASSATRTPAVNTSAFATPSASTRRASAPSVGSVGDSYDNALAETVIGLFKTEVIHRRPARGATSTIRARRCSNGFNWFNHRRLHPEIGDLRPAEYEEDHHRQITTPEPVKTS